MKTFTSPYGVFSFRDTEVFSEPTIHDNDVSKHTYSQQVYEISSILYREGLRKAYLYDKVQWIAKTMLEHTPYIELLNSVKNGQIKQKIHDALWADYI